MLTGSPPRLFPPTPFNISLLPRRFFIQTFIFFLLHQCASAIFRMCAALGRTLTVTMTYGAFAVTLLFTLGGVILSKGADCAVVGVEVP